MTPKVTLAGRVVTVSFGAPSVPPVGGTTNETPLDLLQPISGGEASGWTGTYHVETHGKSDDEIVAEIDRVQLHHEKKSARLDGFHSLISSTFTVSGVSYTIAHVSIGERGTDVELYAAAVSEDGVRTTVQQVYRTVDDVPANAQIVELLQSRIVSALNASSDEAARAARLAARLRR